MITIYTLVAILGFGLTSVGCSNSNFASAGETKSSGKNKPSSDPADDTDVATDSDTDPGTTDEPAPTDTSTKEDEDTAKPGDIVTEEEATCLLKKGTEFRVLFTPITPARRRPRTRRTCGKPQL